MGETVWDETDGGGHNIRNLYKVRGRFICSKMCDFLYYGGKKDVTVKTGF